MLRDMDKLLGWELLKNVPRRRAFLVTDLEFVLQLNYGGDFMLQRAVELSADLGQDDAGFLLEHSAEIKLEEGNIIFPGTVWRDRGRGCLIPRLRRFRNEPWKTDFVSIDYAGLFLPWLIRPGMRLSSNIKSRGLHS